MDRGNEIFVYCKYHCIFWDDFIQM